MYISRTTRALYTFTRTYVLPPHAHTSGSRTIMLPRIRRAITNVLYPRLALHPGQEADQNRPEQDWAEQHEEGRCDRSLEDLPTELIAQTFEYFDADPPSNGPADIVRLCLVSKRLNAIATPLLYREFHNLDSPRTLGRFVRTITQRPQLCKHIKNLCLMMWSDAPSTPPTPAERLAYLQAVVRVDIREVHLHSRLVRNLRVGSYDAQLTLLLLVASRTERLLISFDDKEDGTGNKDYVGGDHEGTSLVLEMLQQCGEGWIEGVLTKVEQATFLPAPCRNTSNPIPCETVGPFFALKSIQRFSASWLGMPTSRHRWLFTSSNIAHLRLHECQLHTSAITAIVAACAALTSLSVSWHLVLRNLASGTEEPVYLDFRRIGQALQKHARSLQYLKFDTFHHNDVIIMEPLTSLHEFTELRGLWVDNRLFYSDADAVSPDAGNIGDLATTLDARLPPNLTTLTLFMLKSFTCFHQLIKAVAEARAVEQGRLRTFTCTFPFTESRLTDRDQQVLDWFTAARVVRTPHVFTWSTDVWTDSLYSVEMVTNTFSVGCHMSVVLKGVAEYYQESF